MNLRNEILKVFACHDVLGFPLTREEAWQEVKSQKSKVKSQNIVALLDIYKILEEMVKEGKLEKEEVFYCLKGRKETIRRRKIRYPISLRKMLRAKIWINIFSSFPFIKSISIAGTVAEGNAHHNSDIDLVAETKRGRLWTTRFFLNAFLSLLRKRPRAGKTRNTFCTSFFYDETFDPTTIMPEDPVYQKWIGGRILLSENSQQSTVNRIFEFIGGIIPESLYRWVQIHLLMPKALREANARGGELDVCFDHHVAKFHLNNSRKEFNDQFQQKLSHLHLT